MRVFLGILAVSTTALVGCAPAQPAEQHAVSMAAADSTYNDLITDIYGTPAQVIAGEELTWFRTQGALSKCMARSKKNYPVAKFVATHNASFTPSPGDLLGFAPRLETFGIGEQIARLEAHPQKNDAFTALRSEEERQHYLKDLETCQGEAHEFENDGAPSTRDELDEEFISILRKIQFETAPSLEHEYAQCLGNVGFKASSLSELYTLVRKEYASVVQSGAAVAVTAWRSATEHESAAARADAQCREGSIGQMMAAATPHLVNFSQENAADLRANTASWATVVGDAAAARLEYS